MTTVLRKTAFYGWLLVGLGALWWLHRSATARGMVSDFFSPFMRVKAAAEWRQGQSVRLGRSKSDLVRELEEQDKQAEDLHAALAQLPVLRRENDELRNLLNVPPPPRFRRLLAHVVNRDPATGGHRLQLDRGAADEVQPGQAVCAHNYLLGRVTEVAQHSAQVITIADPDCRVSVRLNGLAACGVMGGSAQDVFVARPYCRIQYLPRDLEYAEGMLVETSEYGQQVPGGLIVGELAAREGTPLVETVRQLYCNASVRPLVFAEDFTFVVILIAE